MLPTALALAGCLYSYVGAPVHLDNPPPAEVGQRVPDHQFEPLTQHDGRTRLSELYGQPVVLAGWRRHLGEGLRAAWLANELYLDHGEDGLIVILEDRERWEGEPSWIVDVDFWLRFMGTPLWITQSRAERDPHPPIVRAESALDDRSIALIGVDGTLVLEVTAEDPPPRKRDRKVGVRKQVFDALEAELEKRQKGWGEHAAARKARALLFGKGKLAGALDVLERAVADAERSGEPASPELAEVRDEVDRRFAAWKKTVAFYLDEGRYLRAKEELDALSKGVKGRAAFLAELAALGERLESSEGRAALKADKALARILKPFDEREYFDIDLDTIRDLREFVERHPDSPIALRARTLDPLFVRMVRIMKAIPKDEIEERIADD